MYSSGIPSRSSLFLLAFTKLLCFSLLFSSDVWHVKAFISNSGNTLANRHVLQQNNIIISNHNIVKGSTSSSASSSFSYSRTNSARFISLNIELDEEEHDEEEESFEWINEDFVNPQNIAEGSTVKILTEEKFFHVPKLNKLHPEGFCCKDLVAKVMKICIENKDGVICSANRPVIVKFEEPAKFTAHFGFAELDLIE